MCNNQYSQLQNIFVTSKKLHPLQLSILFSWHLPPPCPSPKQHRRIFALFMTFFPFNMLFLYLSRRALWVGLVSFYLCYSPAVCLVATSLGTHEYLLNEYVRGWMNGLTEGRVCPTAGPTLRNFGPRKTTHILPLGVLIPFNPPTHFSRIPVYSKNNVRSKCSRITLPLLSPHLQISLILFCLS